MAGVPTSFTWRREMSASCLPSTTKLVLFVIAEYANSIDDTCWPSLEQLAERASLSTRAVTEHLGVAEEAGWIRRWKSRKGGRKWAHAHYRLTVPEDVARRVRDHLSLDIAGAQADASEAHSNNVAALPEPRSSGAQMTGEPEPRSTKPPQLVEPGSGDAQNTGSSAGVAGSYWNHVPTNNPVNRNYEALSLSQTPVVYPGGEGTGRERDRQAGAATLAGWMAQRLRDSDPGAIAPDLRKWAAEVDGMLADGYVPHQIAKLWMWALQDGFWCTVIRTPARLRKNWDQLRAKRNQSLKRQQQRAQQNTHDDRCCAHVLDDGTRCNNVATSILGAGTKRRGYCRLHVGLYEN